MQQQQIRPLMDDLVFISTDPLPVFNATPYNPPPYTATKNIQSQHYNTLRFGHTNNIETLVKAVQDDNIKSAESYILGVVSAAMVIFAIGLVWSMVIIALKIAGQKRVGFLAGRLQHPDYSSAVGEEEDGMEIEREDDDLASPLIGSRNNSIGTDLEEAIQKEKKWKRKVWAVRATFIISGLCVLVAGALFYAKGVTSFKNSLDSTSSGLHILQDTAYQVIKLTSDVGTDKNILIEGFDNVTSSAAANEGDLDFCKGNGEVARQINAYVNQFKQEIKPLSQAVDENVELFQDDLNYLISMTEQVDNNLKDVNAFFYVTISISIVIGILILGMLVVVGFSSKEVSNCCTRFATNAILWPIFIFFLIVFWIFALVFLVTSISGADFCVTPDDIVINLLYRLEEQFHSVIFKYLIYYVSACTIKPTGGEIADLTDKITQAVNAVYTFSGEVMNMNLQDLETQCMLSSTLATSIHEGAKLLHAASYSLNSAWIGVQDIIQCKTFNPIYSTFVHNALCLDGVGGLTWLFSTSIFLVVFAMIMIMFRAALYPIKRPSSPILSSEDDPDETDENASLMNKPVV